MAGASGHVDRPRYDLNRHAVEKVRHSSEPWLDSFHAAIAAGVPIAARTDAGTSGNPQGSIAKGWIDVAV